MSKNHMMILILMKLVMFLFFVFDDNVSHNIFESIYGADASNPHVYPATLGQGEAPTTMSGRSITTEIAVQMGTSVGMIEKHYSHLIARLRGADLAGDEHGVYDGI